MTVYSFVDESGETRLRGTIDPAPGGGFTPVYCMPGVDAGIDVHAAATYPLKWDVLYDDTFFTNTLLAIPAGLGLTFAFDGSAATITATEDGVWAFTLSVSRSDLALGGFVTLDSNLLNSIFQSNAPLGTFAFGVTVPMHTGDSIAPAWTTTGATVGATSLTPYMQIVRIG